MLEMLDERNAKDSEREVLMIVQDGEDMDKINGETICEELKSRGTCFHLDIAVACTEQWKETESLLKDLGLVCVDLILEEDVPDAAKEPSARRPRQ